MSLKSFFRDGDFINAAIRECRFFKNSLFSSSFFLFLCYLSKNPKVLTLQYFVIFHNAARKLICVFAHFQVAFLYVYADERQLLLHRHLRL